jgi:hypothetical protein
MKPEDIQHGGNHYKDQPKHLQPIYLGTALKLNPIEYSILKYLLRHRKKGGLLDLQKMMHFAQMLWEENHGQAPQITYLTPAVNVEFEFHKQQPDAPFASLLQLLGLQITDAECAILQCLLRHKSNGKVCELRELLQYGQWLIHSEYGMVAVLKQLDEPIDAEFEVMPESQPVTSDNPQESPVCPFKVGDVIHHRNDVQDRSEIKWKVTGFTANSVQVVSDDVYRSPSHIERQVWHRYTKVERPAAEPTELPECPFKVGDVIQFWDPKTSETKWKITHIKDGKLLVTSYDTYQQQSWIELQFWCNYRRVAPTTIDKPAATC